MASQPRARPVLAVLGALGVLAVAGCVSMPTGGPTRSYPVTEGTAGQGQQDVQIVPRPPGAGWSPADIVQGFLTASASYANHSDVAREYLTPQANASWGPPSSAIVYKAGPSIAGPATATPGAKGTVTVQVTGTEQAFLQGYGSYSVPLASSPDQSSGARQAFRLVKQDGQWRISAAPQKLLLTSDSFQNDYQLRDLYFFDPGHRYLVPDPVYVPLGAQPSDLMSGLVSDLITPPADWLSGATKTALPPGTKISSVTLDGVTAVVDLSGAIAKASDATMGQVSSQLLATLSGALQSGSGQTVQSVEVEVNGKPWSPQDSPGNPVQSQSQASASPATGSTSVFYYVDSQGYLVSRRQAAAKPARIVHIGTGFSQVAVSPDGSRLAALRGGILYAGYLGDPLTQLGSGYVSISWDPGNNLWASEGTQVVLFHAAGNPPGRPLGPQVAVAVSNLANGTISGPFTQLRVAPDGVRVALVIGAGSTELTFGAISGLHGPNPQITLSQVDAAPLNATTFTGLTWYGSDDVITLAGPGPVATEYPVSGGSPTSIPVDEGMKSVTASWNNLLVAGLAGGGLAVDKGTSTSWTRLGAGSAPAYPG